MPLAALFAIWSRHLMGAVDLGPMVLMAARIGILDGFRCGVYTGLKITIDRLYGGFLALLGAKVAAT